MKENLATGSHLPSSTHLCDAFKFLMWLILSFDLDSDFSHHLHYDEKLHRGTHAHT